jgi:glycerol-3-phosphate dehydrogenase
MSEPYDLLIIGGGIVGAGAARDAALRGLSVVLVEQKDLAFGTSSRSSKLVHGGLRYLEMGEFSLVFEAVSERRILMDIAPHLVLPLGFLFPVYKSARRGVFTINIGMWLYDGLSLFRSPKIHRNLSAEEAFKEEPALRRQDLKGAPLYYDCSTDDARLTLENALDAAANGAQILTWTRVSSLIRDGAGRAIGARVKDEITGKESELFARSIINATGPWTDSIRAMSGQDKPLLRPTKGVHIVIPAERLKVQNAVVCFHPEDGRVLFAIPWADRVYIGTTDTDEPGDPSTVAATTEDIRYLLEAGNHYFPDAKLVPGDILSTWAGIRPLIGNNTGSASSVSREHEIIVDSSGMITIAGGKLTTYRRMAQEVVERAVALLKLTGMNKALQDAHTERLPLPGAVGWPEDDDRSRVEASIREAGAPEEVARLFCNTYGTRGVDVAKKMTQDQGAALPIVPGRPERMAQVDYAVEKELACKLSDVMVRRTQLYFRDIDQGLGVVERVAERMGALLGWDSSRQQAEIAAYREEVARARAWKAGL